MAQYDLLQDLEQEYHRKLEHCFELIGIFEKLNEEGQKAVLYYAQGLLDSGMKNKQTSTI